MVFPKDKQVYQAAKKLQLGKMPIRCRGDSGIILPCQSSYPAGESRKWLLRLFTAGSFLILLAGCAASPPLTQPAEAPNLSPFHTSTPSIQASATPVPTMAPVPTATPVIYTIARNDTLSSIARRFNITVDALLAANPGAVPEALSVGQTLVIPSTATQSLQATPVPLQAGQAYCQPSGGGTTCLIPVRNPYPDGLENIKLKVVMVDPNGQELASQEAVLPLNVLPAGQLLPAVVQFQGAAAQATIQTEVLSAMRLAVGDARYLKTEIQNLLISVDWNGLTANVQGNILLPANEKPASVLWLAAVAYGENDRIVGFRRWEWSGTLQPGSTQPFALPVYSLGLPIRRVEFVVEARP